MNKKIIGFIFLVCIIVIGVGYGFNQKPKIETSKTKNTISSKNTIDAVTKEINIANETQ